MLQGIAVGGDDFLHAASFDVIEVPVDRKPIIAKHLEDRCRRGLGSIRARLQAPAGRRTG
jgi:hypothetical protein